MAGETPPTFFELPVNNDREAIIHNIQSNARMRLPELKQHAWRDEPLIIVGGGPSVLESLPIIRAYRPDCHLLSINGAYKFLRSEGIESDHFVLLDSREENIVHVQGASPRTNHCLASQVHPNVVDELAGYPVMMFHLGTQTARDALVGDYTFLTAPIGMASVHAIYVAAALGYRTMLLFGYDFSQAPTKAYAYPQPLNDKDDTLEIDLDGKRYRTTLALARTADQFVSAVSPVIRACDLNVTLCSEGLLAAMLKHRLNHVPTEDSEREKYEAIWKQEPYRKVSPGLRYVEEAVSSLGMKPGASVADWGCGLGRCAKWFEDRGYLAVGVDIAANSIEEDVPFVLSSLWDTSRLPKVDYGFSSDVLEHIPPDKVMDTLQAMHDTAAIGCYLNIDTIPDAFGILLGDRLHLTVRPAEEWEADLCKVWPHVERLYADEGQAAFVCRR